MEVGEGGGGDTTRARCVDCHATQQSASDGAGRGEGRRGVGGEGHNTCRISRQLFLGRPRADGSRRLLGAAFKVSFAAF